MTKANYRRFNPSPSRIMHIDLNSCFATIEQQANPLLRGKPIAVAAYPTPRGCILAPSIEAKRFGVKTGMRVMDGLRLCPHLLILESDPSKYRFVNRKLLKLLTTYSPQVTVKSIDEMVVDFWPTFHLYEKPLVEIGREIKNRIKREIGEWLTVSVGISTNPYLAKLAAGLHKPDGLDEINGYNILSVLSQLTLVDLPYIKEANAARLNRVGVHTPVGFYLASAQQLKAAFESINGHYWHLRLHGFPIDNIAFARRSIGHSYALPKFTNDLKLLEKLLCKLVEKMGRRLRKNGYSAQGVHLACEFSDWSFWHKGHKFPIKMYASADLFQAARKLLFLIRPLKPIRTLAVSCFILEDDLYSQLTLFADEEKKRALIRALDTINEAWGEFTVTPATMMGMDKTILDRIAFGGVLDMPRFFVKEKQGWEREMYKE